MTEDGALPESQHVLLKRLMFYSGSVENWRMAANLYTKDHPRNNYFSDLIMIHMSLGLGVKYGKAVALASLVSSLLSFVPNRESVGLHLNIHS